MRVQTATARSGKALTVPSTRERAKDIDYLTACLHARRSRMAEAEGLYGLCRIRSLPEFFHTIFPDSEIKGVIDFQRLSVYELMAELCAIRAYTTGPGADLLDWTLVRFQVENLKVLLRAFLTKVPIEEIDGHLVSLPSELALNLRGLCSAESPGDFVRLVPKGLLQENLERALILYPDYPRPFFFEAALDRGYLQGLVARTEALPREDREIVQSMVYQEADMFHLLLVVRGKFYYGLTPEMLRPLHVEGTRIPGTLFAAMLHAPDLSPLMGRVTGRVLDEGPLQHGVKDGSMTADAAIVEAFAWKRFHRLANLAFRRSHMGLGAIMGYVGLRRVEVANLITISEGIRGNVAAEIIRGRLIPRTNVEGNHV